MDKQNVHASVLMEGLFMVHDGYTGKKSGTCRSLVSTASLAMVVECLGYSSNLRPCTGGRNMLPARKNQDTFVIVMSQTRVGHQLM